MSSARDREKLPWWKKYTLTIEEAAQYFGIGETALRRFLSSHEDAPFLIKNGSKTLIKKAVFEKYLDEEITVL